MQISIISTALFSAVALASAIPDANSEATPKGKTCYWTACAAITPDCLPHFTRETTAKCVDGTTGKAQCCRRLKPETY
ncbi:hypothetical protein FPQ18DRAFT_404052 [Pyronema domesticum]|nr:hypothetical protein FPQ18DRAFT_404052 [Pyronema domesticum]